MDRDTEIVHAGFRKRTEPGPFLNGPQFSSTYTSPGEPSDNTLTYGRFHNPTWTAMVDAAHARRVMVAVDNTTATPYLQQPLQLGADFVVASDAKAITGHSDLILGHVATRDEEKLNVLRTWRTQHGAIPGPMEVWLAHRSLPTLPLRVTRQCESAMRLAQGL